MSNQYVGLSDKEITKLQRKKLREGISAGTHLSDKEIKRLNKLGEGIRLSLDLDLTDLSYVGIPCRTDRFEAIKLMKEYLEINNYKVEGESI